MARQLVLCVHWADDPDLDAVAAAMAPLKAQGTRGRVVSIAEGSLAAEVWQQVLAEGVEDGAEGRDA